MRRLALIALVAGVVLAFGGIAGARTPSSATKIVLDHSSHQSGGNINLNDFVGHLKSRTKRCLAGRTVKVLLHNGNDGSTKLLDADRTDEDGVWAVGGNTIQADLARFVVTRKRIGGRHHRHVCKADSTSVHFA